MGAAIRTGLKFLNQKNVEWILQIDADGQHSLDSTIELLKSDSYDLLIGQRNWDEYKFGLFRKTAQKMLIFILRLNGVKNISDPTSGFRLFSKKAIAILSLEMPSNFIGDTVETLIIAKRHKLQVSGVVVKMIPRMAGESSHTGPRIIKAFILAFLYSLSYFPRRIRND